MTTGPQDEAPAIDRAWLIERVAELQVTLNHLDGLLRRERPTYEAAHALLGVWMDADSHRETRARLREEWPELIDAIQTLMRTTT